MAAETIAIGMTGQELVDALNFNFAEVISINGGVEGVLNVKDYGAVGDGVTSDRTAIMNAVAATAAIDGILVFPKGEYYLPTQTAMNITNHRIKIIGAPGAKIKGEDHMAATLTMWFESTGDTTDTFTTDPVIGDQILHTTAIHGTVNIGDVLAITSTDKFTNNETLRGELVQVASIESGHIHLVTPLYDSYDKATTVIYNTRAGAVSIENLEFENTGIETWYCRDVVIKDCFLHGTDSTLMNIHMCYNVNIDNNTMNRSMLNDNNIGTYGLDVPSCYNAFITHNKISGYNQAIVVGGLYPARDVLIKDNIISSFEAGGAQLDTHSGAQFVQFIGNTIHNGGIYSKGTNINIVGNTIVHTQSDRTGIKRVVEQMNPAQVNPPRTRYETIKNNIIFDFADGLNDNEGITLNIDAFDETIDVVDISGNYVDTSGWSLVAYGGGYGSTGSVISNLNIHENYVKGSIIFYSLHLANLSIGNNTLVGGAFISTGTVDNLHFYNNECVGTASPYQKFMIIHDVTNSIVENNRFLYGGISLDGANTTYIRNNIFKSLGANQYPIASEGDTLPVNVYVSGNEYIDCSQRILALTASGTIRVDETVYGLTGALTDGAPTQSEILAVPGIVMTAYWRPGQKFEITDTNGSGQTYLVKWDGTNFLYTPMTKAT